MNIGSWNVQGWTNDNQIVRLKLLNKANFDIICLTETHLVNTNVIELDGYKWYDRNKVSLHVIAKSGYGGCGILVKHNFLQEFTVKDENREKEGISSLKLVNKHPKLSFVLYCVYLSSSDSTRGRDSLDVFSFIRSVS